jgi:putative oxidoreductase
MINGPLPASWQGYTHAALRVMSGLLFLQHGTAKILGFPMNEALAAQLSTVPSGMLWFTGLMELIGGVLIVIGFMTRPVAFLMSGFMAAAYFIGHAGNGFFPILNFGELAIMFCFAFLWLATAGAGPYSVDANRAKT